MVSVRPLLPLVAVATFAACVEPVLTRTNDPPLAVIRSPQDGEVYDAGQPVDLIGSVTDDGAVHTLDVSWLDNGVPVAGEPARVDDEGNTAITVADLEEGSHAVSLRVVDADNLSFEASVTIEVRQPVVSPTLRIVHPTSGERGEVGSPFGFEVEVSDPQSNPQDLDAEVTSDLDGFLCSFEIDEDGAGLCAASPTTAGEHRLTFSVLDPEENERIRSTVWTVDALPDEPTIKVVSPLPGAQLRGGGTATFQVEVSDRQDPPGNLVVDIVSDIDGDVCEPPIDSNGDGSCPGSLTTIGSQRLTFTVTDTDGFTSSAIAIVQVLDGDDIDDDGDGYTENEGDCNDGPTGGAINPGADELPNGQDDNCNDVADEGTTRYDDDGDGYCESQTNNCTDGSLPGDCDDSPAGFDINPAGTEVCGNGINEDCDQQVDEPGAVGCDDWFPDVDGDGYGAETGSVCACSRPTNGTWVQNDADCDDSAATGGTRYPNATELPNRLDDDCDETVDEETKWYDDDGDGYCEGPEACSDEAIPGDCNDGANGAAINPLATEVCGNGVDENCNNQADELGAQGCSSWYPDIDGDTFGDPDAGVCACSRPTNGAWVQNDGDCDDSAATGGTRFPNATELPNRLDDDCDETVDEGTKWYDDDGDGFCEGPEACSDEATPGDCHDGAGGAAINPDAKETCGNTVDEDCSNAIDDGLGADEIIGGTTYFRDGDSDGFGDATDGRLYCKPTGEYATTLGTDCFDDNEYVYPGSRKPGHATWFDGHRGDNSFDYNCSNAIETRYPDDEFSCGCAWSIGGSTPLQLIPFEAGWRGSTPDCGETGQWVQACDPVVVEFDTDEDASEIFALFACFAALAGADFGSQITQSQYRVQECR